VDCGDRTTLMGLFAIGTSSLVDVGRPELAVAYAAVSAGSGLSNLGGDALQSQQRALAAAREELGPEQYDAVWARFEAMPYDDAVVNILADLDRAISEA